MTPFVVLLAVAAVVAGTVYVHRADWGRATPAAQPNRPASGAAPRTGGQHRIDDAHTGSLSATEILRALNEGLGWVGRVPARSTRSRAR